MVVDQHESVATEWSYELVPSSPLPVLDLSMSIKSRFLPEHVVQKINRFLKRQKRPLHVAYAASLILSVVVPLLDAESGRVAALFGLILGLPLALGSLGSLRYDVVCLLVGTYDFWLYWCVNSVTNVMAAAMLRDARIGCVVFDWLGFQNSVLFDAQLRGIRQVVGAVIIGIFILNILLVCVMLNYVDQAHHFPLLQYQSQKNNYAISVADVVGNGLVTMTILHLKIVYRKRKTLRKRTKTPTIACAMYRCRIQLVPCRLRRPETGAVPVPTSVAAAQPNERTSRLHTVQQMQYVKHNCAFDSRNTVAPINVTSKAHFPFALLLPLYFAGVGGIVFSTIAIVLIGKHDDQESVPQETSRILMHSVIALSLTMCFTMSCAALYQRELLKLLLTSFDFAFYAFQLTAAHICICVLYGWDVTCCVGVAASLLWIYWVLTLDALTPMMKLKLRFHIRFALPVVTMFIFWHSALLYHILGDTGPQDRTIWEGRTLGRHLQIRVIPFYFSRWVTLLLWFSRVVWRLAHASNDDATILRGSVTYENYSATGSSFGVVEHKSARGVLAKLATRIAPTALRSSELAQYSGAVPSAPGSAPKNLRC